MPSITRIAGSFAIIVIAYWTYALLAVRWIEPPADLSNGKPISQADRKGASRLPDLQLKQLQGLFPPDAWELQNPMMLESDRAILLLQLPEHYNRPDGWLEIKRCTIVIPYEGPAESLEQARRQSIILQSPEGALLKFDQPFDLNHFKVGRLVGAQLNGPVTIHSDWKEPGPEDDLWIVTSKIKLQEQTISTAEPVDFRWGPHSGRGQGMVIKLLADPSAPAGATSGMKFSGIESFELSHVERLHLDLSQATPMSGEKPTTMPVDINCRGPFHFDAVGHVATFSREVEVMKLNPGGPADQLACDLLSIFFIQRPQQKPKPTGKKDRKSTDSLDLVPQKIEATGNPVVARVPSLQDKGGIVNLRGSHLVYDLLANCTTLDGGSEVFLQQGPNEIRAPSLSYQSAGPGRLGLVTAQGPGRLHGQSPDRPEQQLDVTWKDKLDIRPHDQLQEIEITGEATLAFPGVGTLQAPEIYFWLAETPLGLRPKSMRAGNNVHISSPQFSGDVSDQLEVWFKQGPTNMARIPPGNPGNAVVGTNFTGPTGERLPQAATSAQAPGQAAPQFRVAGRELRALVVLGDQPAVSNLHIDGNVRFDGDGMSLNGPNVDVNGETNIMRIDGPGQMQFPLAKVLQNPTQTASGAMTVDWRNSMKVEGRKITFDGAVKAKTSQYQQLDTAVMVVTLDRPVRLTDTNSSDRPQPEKIQCSSGVLMTNSSFDEQRRQTSFDQLQVSDLMINVINGEVNAGPGWLNSVSRQAADMLGSQFASSGQAPASAAGLPDKLYCLHVTFQKSITGNIGSPSNMQGGKLMFSDRVRTTYGPVDNWDAVLTATDPQRLGPNGFVAQCEHLTVAQTLAPITRRPSIWLEAADNAKVEGIDFTALGKRITYDQAKGMVILEGDGRNNAELYREVQPGAARTPFIARKMTYSLKTKQVNIDGAQSLDINQIPNGKSK